MNLVLGVSANYGLDELRVFVRSFTRHVNADMALAVQNTSDAVKTWLSRHGVAAIPFESELHPAFSRFYVYQTLLSENPEFLRIFHSDVRDAAAQSDIFVRLPQPGLHVFLEDRCMSIGTCRYNSRWMRTMYGEAALDEFREKPISCVGTILGDRESFLHYVGLLLKELGRFPDDPLPTTLFGRINEQAAHNRLVHSGILDRELASIGRRLHIHENGDGVFTMGYVTDFSVDKQHMVMNPDKSIPAVVHQYDRFEPLRDLLEFTYRDA